MKAIHADPKEIRKIFSEKYIIPDFQRPYSWAVSYTHIRAHETSSNLVCSIGR